MSMIKMLMEKKCGLTISKTAVSMWERGETSPNLDSLAALGDIFEVPLDYFFTPLSNCLFEGVAGINLHENNGPLKPEPEKKKAKRGAQAHKSMN